MIECDSVRFGYGKTKDAELIHGISLSIEDGEFVALTGENGAGKSTFSKLLASIAFLVSSVPLVLYPQIAHFPLAVQVVNKCALPGCWFAVSSQ